MAGAKILIVDDDRDLRLGLNARLRANGFETAFAEDGMMTISIALREKPDAILLDLGLPGGDGFVVLDRLRANSNLAHIPVIVISARDPEANEKRALTAGAVGYFQKPVDNEQLLAMIAEHIVQPT
ncbi:MAG: response regulator [bacterium]|nr:response regulator [bacterium]MCP5065400.1 response regulator [bacterium]